MIFKHRNYSWSLVVTRNLVARAMPVRWLGWHWKLNFSCAVIGLTFINRTCRQRTGTPKFRGSGCQFPQSQCHPSPRTGIALGTRLGHSWSLVCTFRQDRPDGKRYTFGHYSQIDIECTFY